MTERPRTSRKRRLATITILLVVAATLQVVGAQPATSQTPELTALRITHDADLDPDSSQWRSAGAVDLPLSAQESAWPFGGGSVRMLEARAVHSDSTLYIRMEWSDDTLDTAATGVDEFVDAAAIEFPASPETSIPSLCMGQADAGVNIWHWQSGIFDGRPNTIEDLAGNGYVDRYPSTDELYFPARAAGNSVASSRVIQDLSAVGFGSLTPSADQNVVGRAEWAEGKWEMVFARSLDGNSNQQVDLRSGSSMDIAFAIWDGSEQERNGKKSVSQLIVLNLSDEGLTGSSTGSVILIFAGSVVVAGFLLQELSRSHTRAVDGEEVSS